MIYINIFNISNAVVFWRIINVLVCWQQFIFSVLTRVLFTRVCYYTEYIAEYDKSIPNNDTRSNCSAEFEKEESTGLSGISREISSPRQAYPTE